jgi:CheY-like chemotaxis protein
MLWKENAVLPDLILLDLNMPKMDGKQCLDELKKDERLSQIPVFIYTTSSQSKDIEYTLQLGAECFITKPSSARDLQTLLAIIAPNMRNINNALQLLNKYPDWVLSNA